MGSRLLFKRKPLVIDTDLAILIGERNAIVLQQLFYWLDRHNDNDHVRDGRVWTWNTYEEWRHGNFPFWSADQVKRIFLDLEQRGLVLSSQKYNTTKYDRTKWYTINFEAVDRLEELKVTGITHDSKMHDGTYNAASRKGNKRTMNGNSLHHDDNISETTQEISQQTTSPPGGRRSSDLLVTCKPKSTSCSDEVIDPDLLREMVQGTRLAGVTAESLQGCSQACGVGPTLQAIDMLRCGSEPIRKDINAYIYGALQKGVVPPPNFVPFAERKAAAIEKAAQSAKRENDKLSVQMAEERECIKAMEWWESLPQQTQEQYKLEIMVQRPFLKKSGGCALIDSAYQIFGDLSLAP